MNVKAIGTLLGGLIIVAGAANAQVKVPTDGDGGIYDQAGDCPPVDYKANYSSGDPIPDNDPDGVRLGPMEIDDDGSTFEDIVLEVALNHTWSGDVQICLYYDRECDSTMDVGPVCVVARPGVAGGDCSITGEFGCSADLVGKYLFSDEVPDAIEDICDGVAAIGEGCYGIDSYSPSLLAAFDGEAKGGCFWLDVIDCAAGDTGSVLSWGVYQQNSGDPTPLLDKAWSELKAVYED